MKAKILVVSIAIAAVAVVVFCCREDAGERGESDGDISVVVARKPNNKGVKHDSRSIVSPTVVTKAKDVEDAAEEEDSVLVDDVPEPKVSKYADDVAVVAAELAAALSEGDNKGVCERMRQLACFRKKTLLNAFRDLIHRGTPEQRRNALCALAMSFGEGSGKIRAFALKNGESIEMDRSDLGTISDGEPEADTDEDREAQRSHDIVSAVGEGLVDSDASVKQAAFVAMQALDEEERGVLSQQILGGDDSALKQQLLADAATGGTESDLKVSIAGLENGDETVRKMAEANVKAATGQDLITQDAAAAWLEAKTEAAIQKAESEAAVYGKQSVGAVE